MLSIRLIIAIFKWTFGRAGEGGGNGDYDIGLGVVGQTYAFEALVANTHEVISEGKNGKVG